jgi:hypothetical protein
MHIQGNGFRPGKKSWVVASLLGVGLLGAQALPANVKMPFADWSSIARSHPVSPTAPETGDHVQQWIGPDRQAIQLVVKEPHPTAGAPTITLGPVASGADATPVFQAALEQARVAHAGRLVIPEGRYEFNDPGNSAEAQWLIGHVADLTIEGSGATLIFHGAQPGILIRSSQRVKLNGLTVRYGERLSSLARTVEGRDGRRLVVDRSDPVDSSFAVRYITEYDPAAHRWIKGGARLIFAPDNAKMPPPHLVAPQTYASPSFATLPAGRTFLVLHHYYEGPAILIKDVVGQAASEDIVFDKIAVRGSPGMGIVVNRAGRGVAILNSVIAPPEDGSDLISSSFDAINTVTVGGDILISGNRISGQNDDAINLDTMAYKILSISLDGRSLTLDGNSRFVRQGDQLVFFDTDGSPVATSNSAAPPQIRPRGGATIMLSRAMPILRAGMVVRDATFLGGRFAVLNNEIRDCYCHGVLAQMPHGLISGNTFEHTNFNAVRLLTNLWQWKEGVGAFNIRVSANHIADTGPDSSLKMRFGAIGAYGVAPDGLSGSPTNDYIDIVNNIIDNPAQACIAIRNTTHVHIAENHCNGDQVSASGAAEIVTQDTGNNARSANYLNGVKVQRAW